MQQMFTLLGVNFADITFPETGCATALCHIGNQ